MPWTKAYQPQVCQPQTKARIVLLHCSAANGRKWARLSETLGDRFQIEAPDQWGCGKRAPWPGREPFSLAAEAEPVHEILNRAEAPVHLVGHSYGGGLALHIARQRPENLASLSLIEPSAFHLLLGGSADEDPFLHEIAGVAADVDRALRSGEHGAGMGRFVDYWSGEGTWAAMPEEARAKLTPRLAKVSFDFHALFWEESTLADFAGLHLPTLILRGSLAHPPSRRIVEMLAETLPRARTAVIAGAGHMAPLTHPDAVNRLIAAHVRDAQPAQRLAA